MKQKCFSWTNEKVNRTFRKYIELNAVYIGKQTFNFERKLVYFISIQVLSF